MSNCILGMEPPKLKLLSDRCDTCFHFLLTYVTPVLEECWNKTHKMYLSLWCSKQPTPLSKHNAPWESFMSNLPTTVIFFLWLHMIPHWSTWQNAKLNATRCVNVVCLTIIFYLLYSVPASYLNGCCQRLYISDAANGPENCSQESQMAQRKMVIIMKIVHIIDWMVWEIICGDQKWPGARWYLYKHSPGHSQDGLGGTIDVLEQDCIVTRWSGKLFAGIRNGPEQDGIYINIVQDICRMVWEITHRNHRYPGARG